MILHTAYDGAHPTRSSRGAGAFAIDDLISRSRHRFKAPPLQYILFGLASLFVLFNMGEIHRASASCLLSFERAQPLEQGDGLAVASLFGGGEGVGFGLIGRLGLTHSRELHIRTGGCERQGLFGGAFEFGIKQGILTAKETGVVNLSASLTTTVFRDSEGNPRGPSLSMIGFQPHLLIDYPFSMFSDRSGFVALSVGLSAYFVDIAALNSRFDLNLISALSVGIEIMKDLSVLGEFRLQEAGLYGGGGVAYTF
jgi:hypothetical protein